MAFTARELSVLAYANGFTLWHYRTGDPVEVLTAEARGSAHGYFGSAREMLRSGDQIIVNLVDGLGIAVANLAVTAADPAGPVRVALIGASAPAAAGGR